MTPQQEAQFNLFGCGSRCIIKLAELRQKPITKAEFIDRFAPKYPAWNTECGGVTASDIINITRELGLARTAEALGDPAKVRQLAESTPAPGVLILTEREPAPDGGWGELHHVRLLRGFAADKWLLWDPSQDGRDVDNRPFTEAELEERRAHFVVLQ